MWYTLKIWEAEIFADKEESYMCIEVKLEKHDNAPAFWEPTDFENQRWPWYCAWTDFCKFVWIHEMMFCKEKWLIINHPWEEMLNNSHLKQVKEAIKNLKEKYPKVKPVFTDIDKWFFNLKDFSEVEKDNLKIACWYLCRLVWLEYWIDNSLKNHKIPTFKNT